MNLSGKWCSPDGKRIAERKKFMRITTQMLNESARKAGLPINNVSLLNYLNNDSSENSLLSSLDKSYSAVDTAKKTNYEKLEKTAEQLLQKAEFFIPEGEQSAFTKAMESGNNQQIYDGIEALVENYNNTIRALNKTSDILNDYYHQMLQEVAAENSEALGNIGITISRDGTAVIDKDKMKAADTNSLEKVFGTSGTFSVKAAFLAAKIADNAEANVDSLTSQYSSTGNVYSMLNSKYDFRG